MLKLPVGDLCVAGPLAHCHDHHFSWSGGDQTDLFVGTGSLLPFLGLILKETPELQSRPPQDGLCMDSERHSTLACVPRPDCEHQAILVAPKGATVAQPESPCSGILALPDFLSSLGLLQDFPPTNLLPHVPEHRMWLCELMPCWVPGSVVSNAIWALLS